MKVQSLSLPPCWWKDRWSFLVREIFLDAFSSAASQAFIFKKDANSFWVLWASADLDLTKWAVWNHLMFFTFKIKFPALLQLFRRMLHRWFAVKLQKCFVDCGVSPDFPSAWGEEIKTEFWTLALKSFACGSYWLHINAAIYYLTLTDIDLNHTHYSVKKLKLFPQESAFPTSSCSLVTKWTKVAVRLNVPMTVKKRTWVITLTMALFYTTLTVSQWACMRNTRTLKLKQPHRIQPLLKTDLVLRANIQVLSIIILTAYSCFVLTSHYGQKNLWMPPSPSLILQHRDVL